MRTAAGPAPLALALDGLRRAARSPGTQQLGNAGAGRSAHHSRSSRRYVVEFLRRNPTTNTYLGGAGLDPSLRDVDGTLRDVSPQAIAGGRSLAGRNVARELGADQR